MYVKRLDGHSASGIALKRYHAQSGRGKSGFGFVTIRDGYIGEVQRFKYEGDFLKALSAVKDDEILLHHRAPTSTENYIGCTHPVVVSDDKFKHNYYLIHNGVLNNESMLKTQHERLGLEYVTEYEKTTSIKFKGHTEEGTVTSTGFLDSEALAKEFALFTEGFRDKMDVRGSIAFICIQTEKDGRVKAIFYGHDDNRPLIAEYVHSKKKKKGNYVCLKSEGSGKEVDSHRVFKIDYETGDATYVETDIGYKWAKPTNGRIGYTNYQEPDVSTRRMLPSGADDERVIHLDWGASDAIPYSEMSKRTTNDLNSRLDFIQEKLIDLNADKQQWESWCLEYPNDTTCMAELEAIQDDQKDLRKEQRDIEIEIMNRIEDSDYGTPSPYQKNIRTLS